MPEMIGQGKKKKVNSFITESIVLNVITIIKIKSPPPGSVTDYQVLHFTII